MSRRSKNTNRAKSSGTCHVSSGDVAVRTSLPSLSTPGIHEIRREKLLTTSTDFACTLPTFRRGMYSVFGEADDSHRHSYSFDSDGAFLKESNLSSKSARTPYMLSSASASSLQKLTGEAKAMSTETGHTSSRKELAIETQHPTSARKKSHRLISSTIGEDIDHLDCPDIVQKIVDAHATPIHNHKHSMTRTSIEVTPEIVGEIEYEIQIEKELIDAGLRPANLSATSSAYNGDELDGPIRRAQSMTRLAIEKQAMFMSAVEEDNDSLRSDYDNYFGPTARCRFDVRYKRAIRDLSKYPDESDVPEDKLTPRSRYLRIGAQLS